MKNMNNEIYLKYLEMVQGDGKALQYVPSEYQTKELCIEAVKENSFALQYVKKQTPELCLEAVKQNGWSLQFVKNQTPEICLEAVKQDGEVLEFIRNQTPEICLEAVKQNGEALEFVRNQTPEICLEAVKQDGWNLEYVEEQTPEICLEAVKECGRALLYVKKQNPEICMAAVKQDGLALKYVKDRTTEICVEAVKQNEDALKYVTNYELITKMKNELIESKLFKETDTCRAFITDGIDCDSSYISPKDNIERPVTIVLNTKDNTISISFNDNEAKCNAKEILDLLDDYNIEECDNNYVIIDLDGLSDDKISELFTDVIMNVDEFVREHYDLSKNIKDKNAKDIDDMEL